MVSKVTIVDYGLGNLWSVVNAFKYLNCEVIVASTLDDLKSSEILVLPGVGSFRRGMENLKQRHFDVELQEQVIIKKKKILGVCLGMQLMATLGTEDGGENGLGFIPGIVDHFDRHLCSSMPIPHVGFNEVKVSSRTKLYKGFGDSADFYFVHSYRINSNLNQDGIAVCNYGEDFMASYEFENIYATQFHPEKSQENGLDLLSNFVVA